MTKPHRLSRLEQMFLPHPACNVSRSTNIVLFLQLSLPGNEPVSPHHLEIAVRRTVSEHSRLCCALNWKSSRHGSKGRWQIKQFASHCHELPINFRCWQENESPNIPIGASDNESTLPNTQDLILYELNTEFRSYYFSEVPPWRFNAILRPNSRTVDVVWGLDHALGDGLSVSLAARSLIREIDWVYENLCIVTTSPPTDFRLAASGYSTWDRKIAKDVPEYSELPSYNVNVKSLIGLAGTLLSMGLGSVRRFVSCGSDTSMTSERECDQFYGMNEIQTEEYIPEPSMCIGHFPPYATGTTVMARFTLNRDETVALRAKCRLYNTTVTGCLLAALAHTYVREGDLPSSKKCFLSWTASVSLRGKVKESEQLKYGNFSSTGSAYKEPVATSLLSEQFWVTARKMKHITLRNLVSFSLASSILFYCITEFTLLTKQYQNHSSGRNKKWLNAFNLMNLGNVSEKLFGEYETIEKTQVLDVRGAVNADSVGNLNQFNVVAASYNNQLSVSVMVDTQLFGKASHKRVTEFANVLQSVLLSITTHIGDRLVEQQSTLVGV